MAQNSFALLALSLVVVFPSLSAVGQVSGDQQPSIATAFVGRPLTCSQSTQSERLIVPKTVEKRARLKARLLNLLRESLYDDAKGIVNLEREKEIATLAKSLKKTQ